MINRVKEIMVPARCRGMGYVIPPTRTLVNALMPPFVISMLLSVTACSHTSSERSALPPVDRSTLASAPQQLRSLAATSSLMPTESIADVDVDKHIDSDISVADRKIIRAVMLDQPTTMRKNVIYVDKAGHIYSNRSALAASTILRKLIPGTNAVYDEAGRVTPLPPHSVKPKTITLSGGKRTPSYSDPPATTSTGPYRRIYSDPGYTYEFAQVSLPCNATSVDGSVVNYQGPAGDTGNIYAGGWSNSGNDTADAGFQYSASRNAYDVYMVLSSTGQGQIFNHNLSPQCGQTAFLSFYVTSGSVNTNVSLNGQNYYPLTLAEQASNQSDWYGPGDVLKYMVSIAQLSGPVGGVAHDGYEFGIAGNSPQVQINNLALGQCKNGNNPPYAGAGFPVDPSLWSSIYAQMQPNTCAGEGTQNWIAYSVPDDGEVRTTYGNFQYPDYNFETEGIALYDNGGDPPANGSSTHQSVTEKCPTGNDPPNPIYYTNHYTTPDTTVSYYTAQKTNAPLTAAGALTIALSNTGATSVAVKLINPSGVTVASTQIAGHANGGITYYAAGAVGGPYHFDVTGTYAGTGASQDCLTQTNSTVTDAQWTGNFNWH
jgi:hypothetical protein